MPRPSRPDAPTDGAVTVEDGVDRAHAAIRASGGRITRPRVLIVDALVGSGHHLTAERLTEIVREADPKVNEATVYRTLTTLEELGIVYHVHFGHGSSVWHLAHDERPHLVCQRCEQVTHADSEDFRALRDQISKRYGFQLRAHFAEVGLCAACRPTRPSR